MNNTTALIIAREAHKNQIDKASDPYINHPIFVASLVDSEDEKVVALLHDVLEDTDYTIELLRQKGLTAKQEEALMLLTHKDTNDYFAYVSKIKNNPLAKVVKMADLRHNMDLGRLKTVTEKDIKRCDKYKKAYLILIS